MPVSHRKLFNYPPITTSSSNHHIKDKPTTTLSLSMQTTPKISSHESQSLSIEGYRFMDMEILKEMFSEFLCHECKQNTVQLFEKETSKQGSASCCILRCDCSYEKEFYTSKKCPDGGFEVNK